MALLTSNDYAAVRAALGMGVTATLLPDTTIAMPQFQSAAEAEIIRLDASAASRTGTAGQRVRAAAILLTAAYLAPAVPLYQSETLDGGRYSYEARDWAALASHLRGRALAELAAATGNTPETPGGFQSGSVTYGSFMETAP